MSKDEVMRRRDELIATYSAVHRKSRKPAVLVKKERKALGLGRDEGRAVARFIRVSPRKVAIVLDLIKGKDLDLAYGVLRSVNRAACAPLQKLLHSAESNAVNNNEMSRDTLVISEAYVNPGPVLKRMMPRAKGQGYRILKRTSHITLVLKSK